MQCLHCSQEILSTFAFAIKSNQCPACGQNLYSKELEYDFNQLYNKFATKSLEEVLISILNQYSLIEKSTEATIIASNEETTELVTEEKPKPKKIIPTPKVVETPGEKLISQDKVDLLRKRAGVDKLQPVSKAEKFKQMVQEIQSDEETDEDIVDANEEDTLEDAEPLDPGTSLEGLFEGLPTKSSNKADAQQAQKFQLSQLKQLHRSRDMLESGSAGLIKRSS